MTETMACRGPDDRGTWYAQHAALGHRRLAIIDLPGGRQPMSLDTPDGAVANRVLRRDVQLHHAPRRARRAATGS